MIQECEPPDKLKFKPGIREPNDFFWHGDNVHKGVGIFSYSDYKCELLPEFNPQFRHIVPLRVSGKGHSLILLAVWAMDNKEDFRMRYIGQIWQAINFYKDLFDSSTIIIGDFNSNKIWDYKDRLGTHSDVVANLEGKGIQSIYHKHYSMEQGKEKHPTFFLHKKESKPYHIDYCFASTDLLDKVKEFEIGTFENWTAYSDHSPLSIRFNI